MSEFYTVRDMDASYQRVYVQGINDAWDAFKQIVAMVFFSPEKYTVADINEILKLTPAWSVIKDVEDFNRELERRKAKVFADKEDKL